MRLRHVVALATLGVAAAAFVACTLNPQPLPPGDGASPPPEATFGDAGTTSDGGGFGSQEPNTPTPIRADASVGAADAEGGADSGDAGDCATDAGPDADGG